MSAPTDVAEEIRKAVRPQPGNQMARDEDFAKLRAHVAGTLIAAKRQLVPGDEWLVTDMQVVDVVLRWLEGQRR